MRAGGGTAPRVGSRRLAREEEEDAGSAQVSCHRAGGGPAAAERGSGAALGSSERDAVQRAGP